MLPSFNRLSTIAAQWCAVPTANPKRLSNPLSPVLWARRSCPAIRDKPIAPRSPWQNGFAERLIGSIRRECVDHVIALGEAHLRRILQAYARYYNDLRTHRSLDKDAPLSRPVQRTGSTGHMLC